MRVCPSTFDKQPVQQHAICVELGNWQVELLCEQALMTLEACVVTTLSRPQYFENSATWMSNLRLKQTDDLIEARMDTRLTVAEIAHEFNVSSAYFSREFNKAVGRSPHQYIVDRRLARARFLLQCANLSLLEIALDSGFASHSHMTEKFRTCLGATPICYRQISTEQSE